MRLAALNILALLAAYVCTAGCENIDSRTTNRGDDNPTVVVINGAATNSGATTITPGGGTPTIPSDPSTPPAGVMRASVNTTLCTGCGLCTLVCPAAFQLSGGKAQVIANPIPPSETNAAMQAAGICAVKAISIVVQ